MKLRDRMGTVKTSMLRNKGRLFMTILATSIGCSFLIVLASFGFGLQQSMIDEVSANQAVTEIEVYGREDGEELTEQDLSLFSEIENVTTVVQTSMISAQAEVDELFVNGSIIAFSGDSDTAFGIAEGRMASNDSEVIIGMDLHEQGYEIGDSISVSYSDYGSMDELATITSTIVGIKETPTKDWIEDLGVYYHGSAAILMENVMIDQPFVTVHTDDVRHVGAITEEIKGQSYFVYSVTEEISSMAALFQALQAGLIAVGTVAVIIASIGIYNTMTMAVTERTHEIGVYKALGAEPKQIKSLFLMESSFIGGIGVVIGIIVAYWVSMFANAVIPRILAYTTESEAIDITFSRIPVELLVIAGAISLIVAILSGYRPAVAATKISVVEALNRR
ncbi:ABC transporter permease [Paenalkalicoccus suaedae]|uniref:ABC transporter permease n=1 Tax=Paenalkalicoccus suaedae TaxID=2592382 RepID=A0A859FEE5_9BACI|nr:FtsX-like permease family protein [Paenalkalicoccus suaedae]QKS71291.1 ABC transporter permease [Paenalkalicoccus suaedae]